MTGEKIIFWSVVQGLADNVPPVRASKCVPSWWKNAPVHWDGNSSKAERRSRDFKTGTIKNCPGFIDFFRYSYVIRMWCDVNIEIDDKGSYEWKTSSDIFSFDGHLDRQYKEHLPEYASDNIAGVIKANCPWKLKTPKNVSVLQLPMEYHFNKDFEVLSGVVHTDVYHDTNQQMVFSKPGNYFIERGTPLAMYFPFRRDELSLVVRDETEEDIKNSSDYQFNIFSKFTGGYKELKKKYGIK
tara:strand:- start:168 stop:890 length:723 start_codon:yes stop_codon:yes gene_type:complete